MNVGDQFSKDEVSILIDK